jgi:hypothetical protein
VTLSGVRRKEHLWNIYVLQKVQLIDELPDLEIRGSGIYIRANCEQVCVNDMRIPNYV